MKRPKRTVYYYPQDDRVESYIEDINYYIDKLERKIKKLKRKVKAKTYNVESEGFTITVNDDLKPLPICSSVVKCTCDMKDIPDDAFIHSVTVTVL